MDDQFQQLRALKSLLDQGILTQEEFEKKKEDILNTPSNSAASTSTASIPPADMTATSSNPLQLTQKSKIAAGLLAIFLGSLGIHKFYLGYSQAGVVMLLVSLLGSILFFLGPAVMGIIGFIEGIIYLTKTDQQFYEIYVVGRKPWF